MTEPNTIETPTESPGYRLGFAEGMATADAALQKMQLRNADLLRVLKNAHTAIKLLREPHSPTALAILREGLEAALAYHEGKL